jgi:hypothetical protein
MACSGINRCNQMYHDRIIANAEMEKPYHRREILHDLKFYGTSPKLLVSESVIPSGVQMVYDPYDSEITYPVIRLKRFWCPLDGVLTSRIDWTDIEPGTYVEDKFLIKVIVKGDTPITADESNRPRNEMSEIHGDRLEFDTFGTPDAEWQVDAQGRIFDADHSSYSTSPSGTTVTGTTTVETKQYDAQGNLINHEVFDEEAKDKMTAQPTVSEDLIRTILEDLIKRGYTFK